MSEARSPVRFSLWWFLWLRSSLRSGFGPPEMDFGRSFLVGFSLKAAEKVGLPSKEGQPHIYNIHIYIYIFIFIALLVYFHGFNGDRNPQKLERAPWTLMGPTSCETPCDWRPKKKTKHKKRFPIPLPPTAPQCPTAPPPKRNDPPPPPTAPLKHHKPRVDHILRHELWIHFTGVLNRHLETSGHRSCLSEAESRQLFDAEWQMYEARGSG